MVNCIFDLKGISKTFNTKVSNISVLKDIGFKINEGEFVIIIGPSGCGKSTLLHTMLGLESPTEGSVVFLGKNLYRDMDEDGRSDFRKKHVGMVYQQPNWIKSLTVIENVAFPLLLLGWEKAKTLEEAGKVLKMLGMNEWENFAPTELSSGQQQKIAFARALVLDPKVIIADEPTGNLDYESGQELMELLSLFNKEKKRTVIMVTHDLEYLKYAKTQIRMFNGTIVKKDFGKNGEGEIKKAKGKRATPNSDL